MTNPGKRRQLQNSFENISEDDKDITKSSKHHYRNKIVEEEAMKIQVHFEGRNPEDSDYHGIKILLQQLFLKAKINLVDLTNLIISQNYIGSVVKQAIEDDVNDEDNVNDVFGITTIINISAKQNIPCIQQFRDLLKQLASKYATDTTNAVVKNVLDNESADLGFLINERFINIPAQISVPLLENLILEMKHATHKKMSFQFSYLILICKLYKTKEENQTKMNKSNQYVNGELNVIWSNPEEEIFADEIICSFDFSVEKDTANGLSGAWTENDAELVPYRRVILFESSKLQQITDKIKTQIV